MWDANTGDCLWTLCGHTDWVRVVAFSPDGQMLCSSDQDGVILGWDMQTFECIRTIRISRPYEGMRITGATGLTDAQKASLVDLGAIA
ncbi:hypothetical protein [Myxacorys almedinensis]|uniref:Uncharacterized protein n=1 Tax=Myxacorys almedinensis A TaxID=2690445 RepID=A0A8J8CGH6_9CYAN|nr:hypothetical protein [Myxacorys almedinensis A]